MTRRPVGRRRHAAVADRVVARVDPQVAGRSDDDDALRDQRVGRLHQRVARRRLVHRMAERHVDDADVVERVVGGDPFERRDHVARLASALAVENLQRDDVDAGRHTHVRRLERRGGRAAAGDDARDVRAMAEVVVRQRAAVDEVDELPDPARRQVGMRLNAGVDHRDRDADARTVVALPRLAGAAALARLRGGAGRPNLGVERDGRDAGVGGENRCRGRIDHHVQGANAVVGAGDAAAAPRDRAGATAARRIILEADDGADRVPTLNGFTHRSVELVGRRRLLRARGDAQPHEGNDDKGGCRPATRVTNVRH